MTREEYDRLEKVLIRLRNMKTKARIDYNKEHNVHGMGLAEGVQLAYDMVQGYFDTLEKPSLSAPVWDRTDTESLSPH